MTVHPPQNILPVTILIGFLALLTGVLLGLLAIQLGWPLVLSAFVVGLLTIGLFFLIVAWHIRQGLVHGPLVRYCNNMITWFKIMGHKFKR